MSTGRGSSNSGRSAGADDDPLVVVLGASGFVGSSVVAELARAGVRTRAVGRRATPVPVGARIEVVRADLTEPGVVPEVVSGADAIIHLAADIGGQRSWRGADNGSGTRRVNVDLLREVLAVVRHRGGVPPALLFASTAQAGSPRCSGAYVEQKMEAERTLLHAAEQGVVHGAVLRLSTVFGRSPTSGSPGRGVVLAMARRALAGLPITMWHDGSVRRDLLDVRDAAAAFRVAWEHAPALSGQCWAVGTGTSQPMGEVFRILADVVAEHTGREPVAIETVAPPEHAAAADFESLTVDPAPFRGVTGWRARAGLRDGLREVVLAASELEPVPR